MKQTNDNDFDSDEDVRLVSQFYRSGKLVQPSAEVDNAIIAIAKQHQRTKSSNKKRWIFPSSIAASVAVVFFVYIALNNHPSEIITAQPALSESQNTRSSAQFEVSKVQQNTSQKIEMSHESLSSPAPATLMAREQADKSSIIAARRNENTKPQTFTLDDSSTAQDNANLVRSSAPQAQISTPSTVRESMMLVQNNLGLTHAQIIADPSEFDDITLNQRTDYLEQQRELFELLLAEKLESDKWILEDMYKSFLSPEQLDVLTANKENTD